MARTKLGLCPVCTTASVYIRSAQPLMGSIYLIYGQISLLHVPTFTKCNVLVASRKPIYKKPEFTVSKKENGTTPMITKHD